LQKICAPDTTLLSAEKAAAPARTVPSPYPPTMSIPINGVSTSLFATDIPLMRFPCARHAVHAMIPPMPSSSPRIGSREIDAVRTVFAWTSTLESESPVASAAPELAVSSCIPTWATSVNVLPSMERLEIASFIDPPDAA